MRTTYVFYSSSKKHAIWNILYFHYRRSEIIPISKREFFIQHLSTILSYFQSTPYSRISARTFHEWTSQCVLLRRRNNAIPQPERNIVSIPPSYPNFRKPRSRLLPTKNFYLRNSFNSQFRKASQGLLARLSRKLQCGFLRTASRRFIRICNFELN